MYSRPFHVAVILLWLATMSWLVTAKVLPPLLVGDPPSYRTILEARKREPPVGWKMVCNDRQVGWALSSTELLPDGLTEIRSRVRFEEFPLEEVAPGWMRTLLRLVERPVAVLTMEARSTLTLDPLGRLVQFESRVQVDRLKEGIKLRGTVEGAKLSVSVRSGDFSYETEAYLPPNALLSDATSPQTQLPRLRKGQTWTVPAYSPLRPPTDPLEILHATVEGVEPIFWNERPVDTWRVVYRSDPGSGFGFGRGVRSCLWVHPDGRVLRQRATIFDAAMTFERLPDQQATALAAAHGDAP